MKNYRRQMERRVSGLDFIEAKQLQKTIVEAVDEGLIDERDPEYIKQMNIVLQMMDPVGGEFDHMFKNENQLDGIGGKNDDETKNSKWSKVFHAIVNWAKYKEKFVERKKRRQREVKF